LLPALDFLNGPQLSAARRAKVQIQESFDLAGLDDGAGAHQIEDDQETARAKGVSDATKQAAVRGFIEVVVNVG